MILFKKKYQEKYNPVYKYDYIFKCIVNNVNFLTKNAELDQTIDEMSFVTASPGETGAGITFRVFGKAGVSKGGQTVLVCDSHRVRPRVYYHRHKLHKANDGWIVQGMVETLGLLENLQPMVVGEGN